MYFILIKNFRNRWTAPNQNGEIRLYNSLEEISPGSKELIKNGEAKVFCLDHTINEQMIVANKLAELNNMLDIQLEINNSTTGESQQP